MTFPSKHIENAVAALSKLPGIGKKTALRLVFHLLKQQPEEVERFGNTLITMRKEIRFCRQCHNVADQELCNICANPSRQQAVVCVVENFRDVMAIENTEQYNGVFHVLGGIISPLDGIGPEDVNIRSLVERAKTGDVNEVIMALSPTIEGDTTIFYLSKRLKDLDVQITTIARGVSFGGELEYTDDVTLGRSITNRLPYENYLIKR